MAADAVGVPCRDVDEATCVPSVVSGEDWQLLEGELEPRFLQVCWEAIQARGCVVEADADGVLKVS